MTKLSSKLPAGAYVLDCAPYGPLILLQVDPKKLTPEERRDICKGVATNAIHKDLELEPLTDGTYDIRRKTHDEKEGPQE